MRGFGSDNHSGVHPRYLEAIARANTGHAPSYGTDSWSLEAAKIMKRLFGPEAQTFFVFNGTAANVLALSALVKPFHAILASEHAHIVKDECGAPEKNLGCKIITIPSSVAPDAKLTPQMLKEHLIRRGDQHASQVKAVSITQPTELGTLYSLDELRALTEFARAERLLIHMDGARLVNAVEALGSNFEEMTRGFDVVSLGGTKNGLLFGEAVVVLKQGLADDFKYIRKQLMQLPSKTRFVAAQFNEFLGSELWKENARHANQMAKRLYDGLKNSRFAEVTQKCEVNAVFAKLPRRLVAPLKDVAFFYVWDERTFECRFMATWDTQAEDIDKFLEALERLGTQS